MGGGVYGCHLAVSLVEDGHDIDLHEKEEKLFAGASGGCPGRLHLGPHYPRSKATRDACQAHYLEFMARYGGLTRGVATNIYAVADKESLVDFGTYRQVLKSEIEVVTIEKPEEHGLQNVEGAILCGERHIVSDLAREHFSKALEGRVSFCAEGYGGDDFDLKIDATFGALGSEAVDRYEPCLMVLLEGPTDKAVTIVDGPFASIYPWNPDAGLSSLTSARFTPFSKTCRTYAEARALLDGLTKAQILSRGEAMLGQMAEFWPDVCELYKIAEYRLSIRAMPKSAADARLVDVSRFDEKTIRVRAGKIDAVIQAERIVKGMIAA